MCIIRNLNLISVQSWTYLILSRRHLIKRKSGFIKKKTKFKFTLKGLVDCFDNIHFITYLRL